VNSRQAAERLQLRKRGPAVVQYEVYYHSQARTELRRLSPDIARRVLRKIDAMRHDLAGDVKRLKAFVPDYRLRVGD
jgi:mRNA-degrading endonuclease RelE of RelBE toxin-antitoxin system